MDGVDAGGNSLLRDGRCVIGLGFRQWYRIESACDWRDTPKLQVCLKDCLVFKELKGFVDPVNASSSEAQNRSCAEHIQNAYASERKQD